MSAPEEKDPAWELLKKSRPVKASPFFARNVVREVRKLEAKRAEKIFSWEAVFTWFHQPANSILVAGLVTGLIVFAMFRSGISTLTPEGEEPIVAEVEPAVPSYREATSGSTENYDPADEIESIEYLGQLMAVADPAALNDDALADLFF